MPMYFPDLESVQQLTRHMRENEGNKRYNGIYPLTEEELPAARKSLAKYMRDVWKDEVFAMEIELAVSKENYESRMQAGIFQKMLWLGRNEEKE